MLGGKPRLYHCWLYEEIPKLIFWSSCASAPNWDPLWQNTLDMLGLDMSMGMGLPLGTSTIVEGRVTTAPDSGAFGFL